MTDPKTNKFNTKTLHSGHQPDKNFGSRAVPIYQTTSYLFQDADHAAALFNLEEGGHIYSRIYQILQSQCLKKELLRLRVVQLL